MDGDKGALWNEIFTGYWEQLKAARDAEDEEMARQFDKEVKDLRMALVELYGERTRLSLELQATREAVDEQSRLLGRREALFREKQKALAEQRQAADLKQHAWFSQHSILANGHQ